MSKVFANANGVDDLLEEEIALAEEALERERDRDAIVMESEDFHDKWVYYKHQGWCLR